MEASILINGGDTDSSAQDYSNAWWRKRKVDKERGGMLQSSSSGHYCFGPLWLCGRDSHDITLASDWPLAQDSGLWLARPSLNLHSLGRAGWDCRVGASDVMSVIMSASVSSYSSRGSSCITWALTSWYQFPLTGYPGMSSVSAALHKAGQDKLFGISVARYELQSVHFSFRNRKSLTYLHFNNLSIRWS